MADTGLGGTLARSRSDLATRAGAGAAMIAVALVALWLGGFAFWLLASVAALLMLAEWGGLMRCDTGRIRATLIVFAVPLLCACPLLVGPERGVVMLLGGAALVVAVASGSTRLGAGLLYAGLPAIGLIYLREQPQGIALTLWTLAIVWATDIGAYFSGRRFGGPRLAPIVSPNKTWSGLLGGMVAALLLGAGLAALFGLPGPLLFLGAPLAILAQMGDLFESWLKRRAGVKDSGRLLPGHGGALDRLDGVVPVAVLIAALRSAGLI
ncbi:phosphatidate cytidylyltransferase [Sphingomonas oleivorans]|uniref:Phosphatidate cytidylyltransferase n=2 Tax=Sphingomonas oleivorans TaxID=1735121 RepID=A0A2T5FYJ3_9SPHN|nr:phosphatidate cytidylyltransferase [Sphingomonas oleivorans]